MVSQRGALNRTELWSYDKEGEIAVLIRSDCYLSSSSLKSSVLCQSNSYLIGMPVLILKQRSNKNVSGIFNSYSVKIII